MRLIKGGFKMGNVRKGDFFKKGKKIFKVLRKLDPETGTIQEHFVNGGSGENIENVTLKNCKPIALPFTILYPEKAKKLSEEKIEDEDYFSIDGENIDEKFIISKRKEIGKEFKVKDIDITFRVESGKADNYDEDIYTDLVATFYRKRTKQEIEQEIEDDYYTAITLEKKERETYERLRNKFEEKGEIK